MAPIIAQPLPFFKGNSRNFGNSRKNGNSTHPKGAPRVYNTPMTRLLETLAPRLRPGGDDAYKAETLRLLMLWSAERRTARANAHADCHAKNPSTCRVHGTHPGAGQRERETKATKDSLGKRFDPDHPERYTTTDNLARGKKAILRALAKKEDVRGAMYRPEVGAIDFIWGKPGTKAKGYHDGYGISHAFAGHPGDIHFLPEIIAKGTAYKTKSKGVDGNRGYNGRIAFVYGKRAIFVDPAPKGKSLVVTSYRKDDTGDLREIEKNPKA